MKRWLPAIPFVLLTAAVLAAQFYQAVRDSVFFGRTFIGSFLACLAMVPLLSRRRVLLGYLGLLFPFALLALAIAFGRPANGTVTITVKSEGELTWQENPVTVSEVIERFRAARKEGFDKVFHESGSKSPKTEEKTGDQPSNAEPDNADKDKP